MAWLLDDSRPIYLQLAGRIQSDIISGVYKPGDKLPSVRDLAAEAAVNPNTMQKALTELERGGLIYTQRTSGRFISEDPQKVDALKRELALGEIRQFREAMLKLGFQKDEIMALLMDNFQKEET